MLSEIQGRDIYLLDQLLKGRFQKEEQLLDAGCGGGRNMRWFAENGFTIYGCDTNPAAIEMASAHASVDLERFKVADLDDMPYESDQFDHVICNAVLHFAKNQAHFLKMLKELHRVMKMHGTLFIRMTSTFGLPQNYLSLGSGRYLLADGSERFLLNSELLKQVKAIGFVAVEPVKSVLVEELRSMTTLVLAKT